MVFTATATNMNEGFCSSCFKKRNAGASEEELQRDIMVANQEAMKDAMAKEWASYLVPTVPDEPRVHLWHPHLWRHHLITTMMRWLLPRAVPASTIKL